MIYGRNKIIEYTNKSILEDVLSRDGIADENCFTPFNGCAHIMRSQFKDNKDDCITVADIVNSSKEFSAAKARPNDDGVNRDSYASEISDYHVDLEKIDSSFVEKYVKEVVIGYKLNATGLKAQRKLVEVNAKIIDSETGDLIDFSDVEPEEQSFTISEIVEAKNKLPYLLKQLHDGSVRYGGSLLSFIIAAEKFFKSNSTNVQAELRPRHLIGAGVWKMNRRGELTTKFTAGDNTGEVLRKLISWICGADKNNIYYKAYCELLKVLTILDLDITQEDARNYSGSYIDKIVCTYIATNEEYVESYGFMDKKIMSMLAPDKLFEVAKRLSNEDEELSQLSISMIADNIATNIEKFKFIHPQTWRDRPRAVNDFLEYYARFKDTKALSIRDFEVHKGVLKELDGNYYVVDVTSIIGNGNRATFALISTAGKLIIFEKFDITLRFIDAYSAIRLFMGTGGESDVWEQINI